MHSKRHFFDEMAEVWDKRANASRLRSLLQEELPRFCLASGERVLDVGCGTGNLTAALVSLVGVRGRVAAVDLSPGMIRRARLKVPEPRVVWAECDAMAAPFDRESFDRVFCYSVWPHFEDSKALSEELWRVLRVGGRLHIWHSISRAAVNEIHRSSGPAIHRDHLPPAAEVEALLRRTGFRIESGRDDDTGFLVTGCKERADR